MFSSDCVFSHVPLTVFTLGGRCWRCGADVEASTVGHFGSAQCYAARSQSSHKYGLPVVVKGSDECLMETSLTALWFK